MSENTKGAIHFEITASNDELKRVFAETTQIILNSAKTAQDVAVQINTIVKQSEIGTRGMFDKQQETEQSSFTKLLTELKTYQEQRQEIERSYSEKRNQLYEADGTTFKLGASQGDADQLATREKAATDALDEKFAQQEQTYKGWLEAVAAMSLEQLQVALAKAKTELDKAEKSGGGSKSISTARAKVNTLSNTVKKAESKIDATPGGRELKGWQNLNKALTSAKTNFEGIGKAIGGNAGEAIASVGVIAGSTFAIIDQIKTFTLATTEAVSGAGAAASKTVKTVETASVILAVIGAVLQIGMKIASLFNDDKEHQERIESLQKRIDQLKWDLDNVEIGRLKNNNIDILQTVCNLYDEAKDKAYSLNAAEIAYVNQLSFLGEKKRKDVVDRKYDNEILTKSVEKLASVYTKVGYTADKALGEAKYTEAQDKLKNIAQQQLLIEQQIDEENQKTKERDPQKIVKWEQQIQELGYQAIELINGLVEGIIGGSSSEIANQLGSAFIEAFQSGEDAAKAWESKVNEIVANIMKQMLIQKYLEVPLGKVFDKYKAAWFGDGADKFSIDKVIGSMGEFARELLATGNDFKVIWDSLDQNLKDLFSPEVAEDSREAAAARGVASMSQDSANELNGQFTAMQEMVFDVKTNQAQMLELNRLYLPNLQHLTQLSAISENTAHCRRLESIEVSMSAVKNELQTMNLKGIIIRK